MRRLPDINADTITQAVIARHAQTGDARLREVMTSLVQHLHAFAREVRLTEAEWEQGLRFLAEAGQRSDGLTGAHGPDRQELALLSDTLGLSMLVAALAERPAPGATEATLRQPLRREPAPLLERGAWLRPAGQGMALHVRGRVRSAAGTPVAGAEVEVWQHGATARFACDELGGYHFRTALAEPQQIPHGGPVGRLLAALGRGAWRPAHLHFEVRAPGHPPLATHVFRDGSPHLDDDAAFAVRRSLVARWDEHPPGPAPDGTISREPFFTLEFDFQLRAAPRPQQARRAA